MATEHRKVQDGPLFTVPGDIMDAAAAHKIVLAAANSWRLATARAARGVRRKLADEFPDDELPEAFWHDASSKQFREFFLWGHDHDFGHAMTRKGAMGARHIEITAESVQLGFLASDLRGLQVLDIGCWSGGDVLVLSGLGAAVTATEEHAGSAGSARRLMELVGCPAQVLEQSAFRDDPAWRQRFDIVYCSGVLYHVSDPVLLLRICFSYLRPGGRLIIETKADTQSDGSACRYSGTAVKG